MRNIKYQVTNKYVVKFKGITVDKKYNEYFADDHSEQSLQML